MHAGRFVLGYHGCDRSVGESILAGENHVKASGNKHDWLGAGAYFWENDPKRAQAWGLLIRQNPQHFQHRIKDPFVIGAIIDLGNCLDLTEVGALDILREAYSEMAQSLEFTGAPIPENEKGFDGDLDLVKRNLDCAVVNYLHAVRNERGLPQFDSIRAAFWEGKPLFPGARIMDKTHVQICVRIPQESIRGYFRLLPEQ